VMTPSSPSHSAITVYSEPGRNPWRVKAPERSVVVRTTLPPGAPLTARRTLAPATGRPSASRTRPEIRPSVRARRRVADGSAAGPSLAATIAPGSPVTTGNGLSPTARNVFIFDAAPERRVGVLEHPARPAPRVATARLRRRRDGGLKVLMVRRPPPEA